MISEFLLILLLAIWAKQARAVFYVDTVMPPIVGFIGPGIIQRTVLSTNPGKVYQVPNNPVDQELVGLIYPGTKWCGVGNVASTYEDLGWFHAEDACCREHDHCPYFMEPSECVHGFCNYGKVSGSHCICDEKFRKCLQDLNTNVANMIGNIYFNILQIPCFRERRPCFIGQRCSMEWHHPPSYEAPNQNKNRNLSRTW